MPEIPGTGAAAEPTALTARRHDRDHDPQRISGAARQFESLLIGQLLKSTHGSNGQGWLGTGDDQAGEQAMELAEGQLAEALAQQGGLGLAKLVVAGLRREADGPGVGPHSGTPAQPGSPPLAGSRLRALSPRSTP